MIQYQNKKYIYEFASENDGEEIAELLEKTAFKGDFNLIYARRKNAFYSVRKDSFKSAIVVGRDINTKKIKGVGICIIYKMNINGNIENIAYLGGLRVERNAVLNIFEAYRLLGNFIKENNVKYTYTTILKDNLYAQKMLTKKRKFMPEYKKISDYTVSIFAKDLKYSSKNICQKVNKADIEKLKAFIKEKSEKQNFFPQINTEYENFYILKDKNDNILACGILWEQTEYKQIILKNYSKRFKILKLVVSPILKFFNFPKFPDENEIIKYQTLSYVLYENEDCLKDFIKQISHYIDYDFFVYGSANAFKKKFAPIEYKSNVYIIDWDKKQTIDKLTNIYIECALL